MNISGLARALLRSTAPGLGWQDVYSLLVRALVLEERVMQGPPDYATDLEILSGLRLLPWVDNSVRKRWVAELASLSTVSGSATAHDPKSGRALGINDCLWSHCIGVVAQRQLDFAGPAAALVDVYRGAFANGSNVPALGTTGSPEKAVFQELAALHVAYTSAVLLKDDEMMQRLTAVVRWHVEYTQPDHVSTEPWGIAAFAALDETGTFASQQLHDTTVRLRARGVTAETGKTLAILADAVLTMEAADE